KEIVKILSSLFKPGKKAEKGVQVSQIVFVPDERTNSVILFASEDDTHKIRDLIEALDEDLPQGAGKVHVYFLEHAVAEDLAKVLQSLPQKKVAAEKGKAAAPLVSGEVTITPDKATNSLIITAEKDEYLVLEEVIKKLDIPRAMVYIESLFMEVNVDKDLQIGIEWTALGKTNTGSGRSGAFGGGFGTVNPNDLIVPPPGGAGFTMGIISEALSIPGLGTISNIGAIINAYKHDKDVNILTTPQILTTDNQEASIVIAENIPYQTQTSTANSSDTYNSYEYRDVGKILKITPSISKGRMVRMAISLEVSVVQPDPGLQPSTLKRTVDTTVIVKDGNTIVIGGLIEEDTTLTVTKVPCLGDLPLVGWAFKTASESGGKTNLYIFITPHVIESPFEAEAIYQKKQDEIDKTKASIIKMYKNETKVLKALSGQSVENEELKALSGESVENEEPADEE
ncbi:MAG: type II secretion system protein GspD, partial [Deltaproteobacteria bacterium]|nr:type II secretion system protein GspD [Deltaproteobacteria bacterium]